MEGVYTHSFMYYKYELLNHIKETDYEKAFFSSMRSSILFDWL